MKKNFKSISILVAMLVLSLVLGSVAPLAAPAEASAAPTINGQAVTTRRIGATRGRGGVELANAASLRTALQHTSVRAAVDVTPGSMLIRYGSRELLILADSRTAFLTTGVGTRAPSTANVTLTALPRTVANRDLFVPFADVLRHLGGSFTTARVTTLTAAAPAAPFSFVGTDRRDAVAGVSNIRMIGRGATFPDNLYGRHPVGHSDHNPNAWQVRYITASEDLSATPASQIGYNRINQAGADIPDNSTADAFRVPPGQGNATRGSGVGVDAVRLREADFGGTDMISLVPAAVLEDFPAIPTVKGGVAVVFNVLDANGVRIRHLNLTADTIARIYLGRISRWNDAELVRLNPGVRLPDLPIQVNWRPDVSGTTEIFTAYLNAASSVWRDSLTVAGGVYRTTVDMDDVVRAGVGGWTAALLADGTRTQQVHGTGGSALRNRVRDGVNTIGYISFGDLIGRDFVAGGPAPMASSIARVQNRAGLFVLPLLPNVYAAGIGHGNVLAHPVNSANPGAYPIVGLTWIMVERDPGTAKPAGISVQTGGPHIAAQEGLTEPALTVALQRNAVVADFIRWAVVEGFGDAEARRLNMAPLTPAMKREAARLLTTIRIN